MFGIKLRKRNASGNNLEGMHDDLRLFTDDERLPDKTSVLKPVIQFYRLFAEMNRCLIRHDKQLSQTLKAKEKDVADMQAYFQIAADCQKKTAELVNQTLERHSLHPAALAVDMLSDFLSSLAMEAQCLVGEQENPQLAKFVELVRDYARIAESKKSQLGLVEIKPEELDSLDKDCHEIVSTVATGDMNQHKKIHRTLKAGLIYRDKILRQAKVRLYRFSAEKSCEQEK